MARRLKRKLKLSRFFFLLLGIAIIGAGCVLAAVLFTSIRDLPVISPGALESGASTMIYDKDGNLVTNVGLKNSVPVDLEEIPDNVKNAFLAIEDPAFYQHHGISIRGIARAAWSDLISRQIVEGGSTITQQLVKVSFLSLDQTLKRKIQEVILAFQVERRYTKDEILEMYLNNTFFGQGAYGIQAAAQTFFGKDVSELTLEEGALLAGLPQAPSAYNPFKIYTLEGQEKEKQINTVISRRNAVLNSMVKNNFISQEQANQAKDTELKLDTNEVSQRQYPYPYFLDYVTEQLIEKYGEAEVFKGGLKVYTSLDPKIQLIAEAAMSRSSNFPSSSADANGVMQPQGAAVVIDPDTGHIVALVGGREHTQKRSWNRASQTTRQPGSAFKPIAAYGPAIEYLGRGAASVVDDVPVSYGSYSPRNSDGVFRGLLTLREALTRSVNIVAVKLLNDTGINNAVRFASGLGINLDPDVHGLSMALGGLHEGVTPLQMAAAYGAFANHGVYIEPTAIIRVEKADGIILDQHVSKQRSAMKATTAYLITDMLRSVIQSGTGTGAQIGRPAAGKTGTTDEGKDIWFVGYTPELTAAVWIGYDTPTSMPQAYGGMYPAKIWQEIMSKALSGLPVQDFNRPAGVISATVDSKSGLLPGPNTPADSLVTDLFAEGTVPTEQDNVHVFVEVCAASGQLPNQYCPDRIIKPLIKLPYPVPATVLDYAQRVPTETCTIHGQGITPEQTGAPVNPAIPVTKPNKTNQTEDQSDKNQ
ncbi:Penicillin-binding protein 1A [Pelotomaculum sp. FP]|uniref:transglycosylase domain-containing protein n=1 Tax=Pelotomaculum sp. FP TaxID=261474 RepID=UPI001065C541|nr:penicillin-binding protein 1A [Pelotomaculum sp. FP]TEB14845.1 Penicillin-binding protein 1A [Pelotomaculum sp. FP]